MVSLTQQQLRSGINRTQQVRIRQQNIQQAEEQARVDEQNRIITLQNIQIEKENLARNEAEHAISRKLRGKAGLMPQYIDDPEVRALAIKYYKEMSSTSEFKNARQQAVEQYSKAKEMGFDNLEEYQQQKQFFEKTVFNPTVTETKTVLTPVENKNPFDTSSLPFDSQLKAYNERVRIANQPTSKPAWNSGIKAWGKKIDALFPSGNNTIPYGTDIRDSESEKINWFNIGDVIAKKLPTSESIGIGLKKFFEDERQPTSAGIPLPISGARIYGALEFIKPIIEAVPITALFSPAMETGATKRTTQQTQQVEKVDEEKARTVVEKFRELFAKDKVKGKQAILKIKEEVVKSGSPEKAQAYVNFIRTLQQEGILKIEPVQPIVKIVPPIRLTKIVSPLTKVPTAEVARVTSFYQPYSASNIEFLLTPKMKGVGLLFALGQAGKTATATKTSTNQQSMFKTETITTVRTAPATITIPKIAYTPATATQTLTVPKLETKQISIQIQKPKLEEPKIKIPVIFTQKADTKIKFSKALAQAYTVQIRRRGQFMDIASGLPRGRALEFGATKTMKTLGQTFRLLPKGTTTLRDVGFRVPSSTFTRLKRPTAEIEFVERRGKTLKIGTGEVSEIMKAKKMKRGRSIWR
jgi:hypothetical protein